MNSSPTDPVVFAVSLIKAAAKLETIEQWVETLNVDQLREVTAYLGPKHIWGKDRNQQAWWIYFKAMAWWSKHHADLARSSEGWTGERIVAAAVQFQGTTISMPPPARHHTILHTLFPTIQPCVLDQGFLTSDGRYVTRAEAWVIANRMNQVILHVSDREELFSENLW